MSLNQLYPNCPLYDDYDFIIVGGGTSGLVLGSRLTQHNKFKVLVLEAGTDQSDNPLVKQLFLWMDQKYTELRWQIFKQKDDSVLNPDLEIPVAKMLGGGTSVNPGGYERGNAQEWNRMADIVDDPSWRMENLDKYFKRIENAYGLDNDYYHGGTTPIMFGEESKLSNSWFEYAEETGYPISVGFNDPDLTYGLSFEGVVEVDGERRSTVQTYYENIASKKLTVLKNAQVSRLIIKECDGQAVACGVVVYYNGSYHKIKPKHEIIMSCGTILTPFILQQSKLPVDIPDLGKNLYDSSSLAVIYTNNISSSDEVRGVKPVAFLSAGDQPDTLYIINSIPGENGGPGQFIVVIFCMADNDDGEVSRYDKNPFTMPKVNARLLKNDKELEKMIKRIEMADAIMNSNAMSVYNPQRVFPAPGEDLQNFVLTTLGQAGHFVGTCRMGNDYDEDDGVVDTRFKVKKIKRLRIVDASIIPVKQDLGTMAASLVVGEKASDIILEDYSN